MQSPPSARPSARLASRMAVPAALRRHGNEPPLDQLDAVVGTENAGCDRAVVGLAGPGTVPVIKSDTAARRPARQPRRAMVTVVIQPGDARPRKKSGAKRTSTPLPELAGAPYGSRLGSARSTASQSDQVGAALDLFDVGVKLKYPRAPTLRSRSTSARSASTVTPGSAGRCRR